MDILFWILICISAARAEIDPLIIKGNRFFHQSNGTEFYVKSVDYKFKETDDKDPLVDESACRRDIPYLKSLNINVVESRPIDPSADHDGCMNAFAAAGIYVLVRLDKGGYSVSPWSHDILRYYNGVIDTMNGYTNTMAFTVGLPVANAAMATNPEMIIYPHIKAAIRDIKGHIKDREYRAIPIGYAWVLDEIDSISNAVAYMSCPSVGAHADFNQIKLSWGAPSSDEGCSHANEISDILARVTVASHPVMAKIRYCGVDNQSYMNATIFSEIEKIFSADSSRIFSGYNFFEYFSGLVDISDSKVTKLEWYTMASTRVATIAPQTTTNAAQYSPPTTTLDCPVTNTQWSVATSLPPVPNVNLCSCMVASLRCSIRPERVEQFMSMDPWSWRGNLQNFCGGKITDPNTTCVAIQDDGNNGQYGAFSGCNQSESLSWAANLFWKTENKCDRDDNSLKLQELPAQPEPSCVSLLEQAGKDGIDLLPVRPKTTTTGSPLAPSESPKSHTTIGTAAIISIAISFTVAFLIAGLITLYIRRRKQKSRQSLQGSELPNESMIRELYSRDIAEAPPYIVAEVPANRDVPQELHGDCPARELDATHSSTRTSGWPWIETKLKN